jgi:cytochrome P450
LAQRVAREDLVVRGKTIRKGEILHLALGAANRDPEVFVEPDRFEISRAPNPHLAFGSGAHQCLGMHLGRRELEISLGRLVQRMPRLRLDKERPMRRRFDSLALRGLESLPVRFD